MIDTSCYFVIYQQFLLYHCRALQTHFPIKDRSLSQKRSIITVMILSKKFSWVKHVSLEINMKNSRLNRERPIKKTRKSNHLLYLIVN